VIERADNRFSFRGGTERSFGAGELDRIEPEVFWDCAAIRNGHGFFLPSSV
jgi:hypothetical protein